MICAPGTTPDILPGFWGVYNSPVDGDTFMGLITRADGSYESVTQRLAMPLKKGLCYTLSLYLSHSKVYAGYSLPLRIRLYGGQKKCKKEQLLYESPLIDHLDWKRYHVEFESQKKFNYIIFEAFISEEPRSYKGNILIDHISSIRLCSKV